MTNDFEVANKFSLYGLYGEYFNIEAVCPFYLPDSQCSFTWHRDEDGYAIVSGYDPEFDPSIHWLCWCGEYITNGSDRCPTCHNEAPWGAESDHDEYDEEDDDYYPYPEY